MKTYHIPADEMDYIMDLLGEMMTLAETNPKYYSSEEVARANDLFKEYHNEFESEEEREEKSHGIF